MRTYGAAAVEFPVAQPAYSSASASKTAARIQGMRNFMTARRRVVAGLGLCASLVLLCPAAMAETRPGESAARQELLKKLVTAAIERTHHRVRYDPAYVRIPYPGGDVPADTGVCTDEVIRSYRALGIDLQKEVHEDMAQDFSAYPRKW